MPFTFAHPAAVLPIHARYKRWLSLPALVVGSLLPDAAYYLPLPEIYKNAAHTWWGALFFTLPLGLLVLLIFYWLAPEVAYLLPSPHREALAHRFAPVRPSIGAVLFAAVGLVLGAETHVLWDSFTHETGWAVLRFSWLRVPLWHERAPVYFALQVLSTLVGLAILGLAYYRWMRSEGFDALTLPRLDWRVFFWMAIVVGCTVAALAESHTIEALEVHRRRTWHFGLVLVTSFIADFLLAACAAAIIVKIFHRTPLRSHTKPRPAQTDAV